MEDIKHISLIELKNRLDEIEKEKQEILKEMDRRFPGMGTRIRYEEAEVNINAIVEVVDELISKQFNIKEKEIYKER